VKIKVLHKYILIKPDDMEYQCDDSTTVLKTLKDPNRKIILPDRNTLEKISPFGTVVQQGSKVTQCKVGDRVYFDRFADEPWWYFEDGVKYRVICEHYLRAIVEED